MKHVFVFLLVLMMAAGTPSIARAVCPVPAQNYRVDGGKNLTTDQGYTIRIMYGSARNCLGNGDNQGKFRIKLSDTSVDGYTFCTSAVKFNDPVRFFDDDYAWGAAGKGAGVMGILIFDFDSGAPSDLDNANAGITMRNRTGGDDMWDLVAASGYYQVTDANKEDEANRKCVEETKRFVENR